MNDVTLKVGFDIDKFAADLRKTNSALDKWSGSVKTVASAMGIAFGARQIFNGIKYGVEQLANFQRQMQEVRAVSGANASQFQDLKKNAQDLGAATEYTATQVGGLQAEFARLGFSTSEIIKSTSATLNLATATGSDLANAAKVAGATLRGFGLDASQMGRVTDVMSASFNKSALQLDSFTESMKYVAPIAAAAGISIEETTAYLSALADSGIKGSQAGTSLRRIFSELSDDGRPVSERMEELSKRGLTLADSMDEVGRYAQTALLVLSNNNEKVKQLTETYKAANGAAKETSDLMRDTLIGDFKLFTSAIDGAIQKGEGLIPVLRGITQAATNMVKGLGGGAGTVPKSAKTSSNWFLEALGLGGGPVKETHGASTTWEETAKQSEEVAQAVTKQAVAYKMLYNAEREYWYMKDGLFFNAEKGLSNVSNIDMSIGMPKTVGSPYDTAALAKRREDMQKEIAAYQELVDSINYQNQEIENASINLTNSLGGFISDMAIAFGQTMSGAVDFGQAFLRGIANFAVQFGETLIGAGVAALAIDTLATNPYTAIIAGAALVAIGAAVKGSLSSGVKGLKSGGGGSYGSAAGSQSSFDTLSEQRLYIEMVARGEDLVAVYDSAQNNNRLRRG